MTINSRVEHADELPYDGTASELEADNVQAAIDEVAAGGVDPDDPIEYQTWLDADGVLWMVTMGTDGQFTSTSFRRRVTTSGDLRVTTSGDLRTVEG